MKTVLLGAAAMTSVPALAQTAPTAGQNGMPVQTVPAQSMPAPAATSDQTMPQTATPAPTTPETTATAQAGASAGTTTSNDTGTVQQVVDQSWSQYDKDGNGVLSKAEFTAWMVDLRKQTDPKASAASAKTTAWANGAFLTADKDKSKTVTKTELASYLSGGTGGAGSK